MKDIDNPVLGGGSKDRSEAAAGGGGDDGGRERALEIGAARAASEEDAPDPLRSDKFLKGFFGR